MAIVYKIEKNNAELKEVIKWLQDNVSEIKDFMYGVRFTNGNITLDCEGVPLETLATMSKMLDLRIDEVIQGPDEDEDDDLEEDELE